MKQMTKKRFNICLSLLLTLCLTVSMIFVGTPTASASVIGDAIVEKAVDQLIEDGMRLCCMGIDWLGEATGNEDVQKAFSFIEEWVFMDSTEIAVEELAELCEQIIAELDEIEEEMTQSFALLGSVLAKEEVTTARGRVDAKWTNSVDDVIKSYQAANAFTMYKKYLTDAVNGSTAQNLENDLEALITAYSGMYPGSIPVEMNTPEKLKELMFEQGTINTKFSNMITDLAAGLNYDPLVKDSVALLAAQFAYKAYPFSHQQYQYLHAVMEKQIMYIILVEMMYNEYLYQQGEYLKDKYGEDSDKYKGYLGYQTSFHNLMTSGDSCVNALIAKMLDSTMPVDGIGEVNLKLSDYMRPEDAVSVSLEVKGYESQLDFKQEVKDNGVFTYKIRDGSNISKSKYSSQYIKFNRVMTHTKSGNKVYYILDPSQYSKPYEAMAIGVLDHKVDIRADADIHAQSCDYANFIKDMSDGTNTYHIINDPEMKAIAPLFDTNYFALSGSTVDGYLGGTGPYIPAVKSGTSGSGFEKIFYLTSAYRRTDWAPAITSYTQYKALDGSKIFSNGKVTIKDDWKEDVLDTGSKDFKNNTDNYGYSVILSNKSSTYKQKVSASIFRNEPAEITVTALDGESVSTGGSMLTESGKTLDIAINGMGVVPDKLTILNGSSYITIATSSDFKNMETDEKGLYHVRYTMPYSATEFVLFMPENTQNVSIGKFVNGTASLDKNTEVLKLRYRYGQEVNVYIRTAKGYIPNSLEVVDKKGKLMTYSLFQTAKEDIGNETLYTYQFTMNYTCDLIINGTLDTGITESIDTDKFIYDSNNGLKAYIQLQDYNTKEFYDESLVVTSISNTVYGRYIFDDDYLPAHMKVVGLSTGTVFYDRDVSGKQSGDTFMLINQLMTTEFMPFGEDVIVIPTFVPNDPKVSLDDFRNCSASFDKDSDETEKRFKSGDTVTFYLRVPADCNNIEIKAEDSYGNDCDLLMAGEPIQDGTDLIYTYQFTMPSTDVIVGGQAYSGGKKYTATISTFTGGVPSFSKDSVSVMAKIEEYSNAEFYVRAPENYGFSMLSITDSDGKDISYYKAADNIFDGNDIIYTIGFQMPSSNVVIKGTLEECLTASADKSGFVYDNDEAVAYIELKELSTDSYSSDSVLMPSYVNSIQGRFVYNEDYCPTHLKIVGADSGKVFYDEDRKASDTEFFCITDDNAAFGEDIIVIPTFAKTETPEPVDKLVGIRTYEELVEFAENVRNDYANYGSASVWLENYIVAPEDSTWSTPIGSVDQPFNGTFDGRGLAVAGLNIKDADVGGLFGSIGPDGVVKDLAVVKVNFSVKAKVAGGIAAYNFGLIDHCISGVNTDINKLGITTEKFGSVIYGTVSGGIAGYNNGTITGTRSCAYVIGTDAAGIACVNNGTIYGSANNGPVGKDLVEVKRVGGIAVENKGSISACYNSNKQSGSTKTVLAALVVKNEGIITDSFYNTFSKQFVSIVEDSAAEPVKTAERTVEQMMKESFADEMNSVSDDTVSWRHFEYNNKLLNKGFPVVKGRFIENVSLINNANLKVNARINRTMSVNYMAMNTVSVEYAEFEAASDPDMTVTCAYDVTTADSNGQEIPSELWCEGVTVSVPVSSKDVQIITKNDDGETVTFAPDSIEDGWATFTLTEPAPFAVAEKASSDISVPDQPNNNPVRTGDSTLPVAVPCVLIIISAIAVLAARRRKERE